MERESLVIKNFGPIREVNLQDIKPLTVIIGPSGVGKSSILKVLSLFRWLYKMQNIRIFLRLSGVKRSPFRYVFPSYIKRNGWTGFVTKETHICYQVGECVIEYKDSKLSTTLIKNKNALHLEKVSFISDGRIIIPDILAGRATSEDFYANETYKDFRKAMDQLHEVSIPYLGVRSMVKHSSSGVEYKVEGIDQDRPYSILLQNSSSGTQSVIPMVAIIRYFAENYNLVKMMNRAILNYVIESDLLQDFRFVSNIGDFKSRRISLMIEEPELSLSPNMQTAFIKEMSRLCFNREDRDYTMSLVITTHSPYIVNLLNLLIQAHLRKEDYGIAFEDLDVYKMDGDGTISSLKALNTALIDTMPLSQEILDIYHTLDDWRKERK